MKNHDLRSGELSMRVFDTTRRHAQRHPLFLMADIVAVVKNTYGISRAQAFRLVRMSVDVLGIHYDSEKRLALSSRSIGDRIRGQNKPRASSYFRAKSEGGHQCRP